MRVVAWTDEFHTGRAPDTSENPHVRRAGSPGTRFAVADLLAIYLRDHFAGASIGAELVRRAAGSNRGTELGTFLDQLAREIDADRRALLQVFEIAGLRPSRVKTSAAWTLEKVGRLKLNGRVVRYSPLSRLLELEGLTMGIAAKRSLWQSLGEIASDEPRLAGLDFSELEARAQAQQAALEPYRREAARTALLSR
jgi:hypothetical protein